jgi:2-polyprenyl-6-methoxyphenol hydroxylase-like FAD-dependent oxidoreductase
MQDSSHSNGIFSASADYDAVIVGASLAGCTAAMLLGRSGARVALVEKRGSADAFKRVCSHFIQASAVPTLERAGLLDPIMAAGGLRSHIRMWTRWGWIVPPRDGGEVSVNLRRELLDPLVRSIAAETPGVELLLGRTASALVRDDAGAVTGVVVQQRDSGETTLRGKLVIGADGRDSRIAELAGVPERRTRHERFAYGAYFAGTKPDHWPDATVWMTDPQWAAAFPTDGELTFYAAMPTKPRLAEFKRDPERALVAFLEDQPEPPPIGDARLASPVIGKLDMENRLRRPVAPGLALIGDAALAIDPLWGVGCGWAFQSAEWLADAVAPALRGAEPLEDGLQRYRRRHARGLRGHALLMVDYARGRRFNASERLIFSAAARDERVSSLFEAFGTRQIGPARAFPRIMPLALAAHARALMRRGGDELPPPTGPTEAPEREREAVAA